MQNISNLHEWIGRQETKLETVGHRHAELMAVTLGVTIEDEKAILPLPWHWGWFNDAKPSGELGRDGHPKRGGFLPPVSLPRRMWAGGSIEDISPIFIGDEIRRVSTIMDIREKTGRSGPLCIVTVSHELYHGSDLCVRETQNLVYREDPAPDAPTPSLVRPPENVLEKFEFTPDPVLMFRYSALTFNGHRIHYDVDYARDVEGYRGLVFHAPLTATFLYKLASEMADGRLSRFTYRATTPLYCNEPVKFLGKKDGEVITVCAVNQDGSQAMVAEATPL